VIAVQLNGGLGNQLFQYAAGRSISLTLGVELLLNPVGIARSWRKQTARPFELWRYDIKARLATEREQRELRCAKLASQIGLHSTHWNVLLEHSLDYNGAFAGVSAMTYLIGYWQSHRYFKGYEALIANEMTPTMALSSGSARRAGKIESGVSVGIHVRRGDYVTLKAASKCHGVLPSTYYELALTRIREAYQNLQYYVFSDDPNWCRNNLPFLEQSAEFIDSNTGLDAWQDLFLLSRCRHLVIANSSFSWWGGWLSDQFQGTQDRIVIAPWRWFANVPAGDDRYPSHWLRL
jgi:hypothetical protein